MFFNKENAVTKQLDLSSADVIGKPDLSIAYGIDRHFLYGCGISMASLLKTNPDISFSFYVFTDYFDRQQEMLFQQLAAQYKTSIKICLVNCEQLKTLPNTKNLSYATYFRFIIVDYFSEQLDRMIYMDADIICKGSLKELLAIKFANNEIVAAVADRDRGLWQKRADALGVPALAAGYFNAGFLIINLAGWFQHNISAKVAELLSQEEIRAKIAYLDQDILNMLLSGKVIFLDAKYNTQYSINHELQKGKIANPITEQTILIHYIGPTKPWHEWASYNTVQPFTVAKMASPWKSVPLLKAKSSSHLHYQAKHLLLNKNYLSALKVYLQYVIRKTGVIIGLTKLPN